MRKDLSWNEAHRWHRRRGRRAMAGAVVAVVGGTLLAATLAVGWRSVSADGALGRFRAFANEQPAVLDATTARYVRGLSVTRGFFEASSHVTEGDFATFVEALELKSGFPAMRSIEFIEQAGDGTYPVRFVAPATAAPGLLDTNIGRDTDQRAALDLAVGGGVTIAPPTLDHWARPRILMVSPVMHGEDVIGWIGATIDPAAFGREVLAGTPEGVRGSLAWSSREPLVTVGPTGEALPGFSETRGVEANEALWTLEFDATPGFAGGDLAFPWTVFFLGLVPAILAAFVLFFLGRSRMRALLLAERLGRDLAVSEARARAVTEAAVEAIFTTDAAGTVETANPAAEALFGWPASELVGKKLGLILPSLETPEGPDGEQDVQWSASEQMLNGHRRDGSVIHVDVSLAPTYVDEQPLYVVIARDATLRKMHEDQLTHQATHDTLTGLANRQLFDELLVRAAYRTDRSRAAAAVLFVDLDGFKDVNDIFGHQAGDRVLAETARRLEAAVRPGDVVARLGGDEFAVLCENLAHATASERIAERIVEALRRPIPVASGVAQISASVGVAVAVAGEGAASVLSRADQAMYDAKRAGKAGFVVSMPVG